MYLFEKDEPDESYCHDACASVWPPLTTSGTPVVEAPLDSSKVTLLKRGGGLMQVVYAGHPLYPSGQKAEAEEGEGGESDAS